MPDCKISVKMAVSTGPGMTPPMRPRISAPRRSLNMGYFLFAKAVPTAMLIAGMAR